MSHHRRTGSGRFTGSNLVVESNTFPVPDNSGKVWSIQMLIKGTGRAAIGLVSWTDAYDATYVDWGRERWDLGVNSLIHLKTMRRASEAVEAMLRIEVEGSADITITRVLVEPGPLTDWRYFDGDEQYGAPDDFSWYGTPYESYSLWYNNKRSITSRLFAQPQYPGTVFTEQDDHGLAYNWVPAGTVVAHHLDVLRPYDLKTPPPEKTGVMPNTTTDPAFGVVPGTSNVIAPDGNLILTTDGEEVHTA